MLDFFSDNIQKGHLHQGEIDISEMVTLISRSLGSSFGSVVPTPNAYIYYVVFVEYGVRTVGLDRSVKSIWLVLGSVIGPGCSD